MLEGFVSYGDLYGMTFDGHAAISIVQNAEIAVSKIAKPGHTVYFPFTHLYLESLSERTNSRKIGYDISLLPIGSTLTGTPRLVPAWK